MKLTTFPRWIEHKFNPGAPGLNLITSEVLKELPEKTVSVIKIIFNSVL